MKQAIYKRENNAFGNYFRSEIILGRERESLANFGSYAFTNNIKLAVVELYSFVIEPREKTLSKVPEYCCVQDQLRICY